MYVEPDEPKNLGCFSADMESHDWEYAVVVVYRVGNFWEVLVPE